MPPEHLSRRSFLALAGGATLLAACGSSSKSSTTDSPNDLATAAVSSDLYASPGPQRFAFVIDHVDKSYASGAPARIAIRPPNGRLGPYLDAPLHSEGLPTDRGVYVVTPQLAVPGVYDASVQVNGKALALPFQVNAKSSAPKLGAAAPRVASPTTTNALGVSPICTRKPQCPLHTTSLSALIGKGRPVAAMFATPALCQSKYCGPVLDMFLPIAREYATKLDAVHVEIYNDLSGTNLSPTVQAWNLPSEPWLFTIDAKGTVVGRLDGAFASDEVRQLLDRLAAA